MTTTAEAASNGSTTTPRRSRQARPRPGPAAGGGVLPPDRPGQGRPQRGRTADQRGQRPGDGPLPRLQRRQRDDPLDRDYAGSGSPKPAPAPRSRSTTCTGPSPPCGTRTSSRSDRPTTPDPGDCHPPARSATTNPYLAESTKETTMTIRYYVPGPGAALELPPAPIGVLAVGAVDLLHAAADLPQPRAVYCL